MDNDISNLFSEGLNEQARTFLLKEEWPNITGWIRTQVLEHGLNFQFSESTLHYLFATIVTILRKFMWYNCLETSIAETLTDTLKALRLYATNKNVAEHLMKEPSLFDIINALMDNLFTKKNTPELYSKYLLQFLVNLLSSVKGDDKNVLIHIFHSHMNIETIHMLFYNRYGQFYEVSAVLYNIYCGVKIEDADLLMHVLQYHADNNSRNEYIDFLVDKIMLDEYVWQHFGDISQESRVELLVCLREKLICGADNRRIKVEELSESCLSCLTRRFNTCASIVFQMSQQENVAATEEVSYVLELLAHLSGEEKCLERLQTNKDILINAGVLLINAHMLGKSANNAFTPIQKLSEIQNPSHIVRGNPVFGFKADLVRLIGNLCWKNRKMQDLAREGELIPVLLDSCNIDAKNPYIIQWVILAIRNICENNLENQDIIAGLTRQGTVNSEVLQEFGLVLHSEDDLSIGLIRMDIN